MKQKLIIFAIITSLFFTACTKVIPLDAEYENPRLVVNTLLYQDSLIKVDVSTSRIIIDNAKTRFVSGATVALYKNEVFLENLTEQNETYISTHRAEQGVNYMLKVTAPSFEPVECQTKLPHNVPILQVDTSRTINEYGSGIFEVSVKFPLREDKNEYFLIRVKQVNPVAITYPDDDYIYYPEAPNITSNDIVVEGYFEHGLIFSDQLINTNTYTFVGGFYASNNYNSGSDTISLNVELISLNQSMYDYLISLEQHNDSQGDPMMEPVIVYSNVSSGMGIMGGASRSIAPIKIYRPSNTY